MCVAMETKTQHLSREQSGEKNNNNNKIKMQIKSEETRDKQEKQNGERSKTNDRETRLIRSNWKLEVQMEA